MKDLKCSLRQCEHNDQFCCCAKSINVNNEADCTAYTKVPERNRNLLFEIGSIDAPGEIVDTDISCNAMDCAFNRSEICIANGITVLSAKNTDQAECATYLKK